MFLITELAGVFHLDSGKFPVTVFGSILGTGGFALASRSFLPPLVFPLAWMLLILFFTFSGIFLMKLLYHPGTVRMELADPLPGNFYALQPISAVLLSIIFRTVLPPSIVLGLLVYGAVMILSLSIYLPYHFFSNIEIEFRNLHGGWFITPVATVLVTNAILLYPVTENTAFVALVFFGIGTMLFLLIMASLFYRLISHTLPPAELAPTNYIMLAPVGILIVDIVQISRTAGPLFGVNLTGAGILAGIFLWGFGIWAIGVNILLLFRYIRTGLKFHIGWWSYVFPTAAFTMGTVSLESSVSSLRIASVLLYAGLLIVFVFVGMNSLRMALRVRKKDEPGLSG